MKIGIVTIYENRNIGNKFQNYAIEYICRKFNHECYTIALSSKNALKLTLSCRGRLVALVGFPKKVAINKRNVLKNYVKYTIKFNMFSANNLHVININSYKLLKKFADTFDAFIVGSDQVWHNWNNSKDELDYFFLKNVPYHKRICLSPSFGFNNVPPKYKEQYVLGLNGFKYLSCREESGCKLIKKLTGRDSELLIDPTFMLDPNEWDKIAQKNDNSLPAQYILTYFLGEKNEQAAQFIKQLSEDTDLPVIEIDNNSCSVPFTPPDEFLYLIKNATYFCTNSFHGCVFSILYNINFYVFKRMEYGGMSSRIETLLKTFKMEDRNCFNTKYEDIKTKPCNFDEVDFILNVERKKVVDYLKKSFDYSNKYILKENKC